MYKTEQQAEDLIQALLPLVSSLDGVDLGICVPFTDLRAMIDSARGSRVEVYAQNMHHEPEGPFTGEISAPMLVELGVHGVVLGHSERRELFGETDRALALKVPAALDAGLVPILCVGETEQERDDGDDRAQAAPPDPGGPRGRPGRAPDGGRDRLRADLGDRHRPRGEPRAGPGGVAFIRALIADRDAGAAAAREDPLRRLGQARERRRAAGARGRRRRARRRRLAGGASRSRRSPSRRSPPRVRARRRRDAPAGPADAARPARLPGGARRLGAGRARPRQRDLAGRARPSSTSCGSSYPHTTLRAWGRAVGLPEGRWATARWAT